MVTVVPVDKGCSCSGETFQVIEKIFEVAVAHLPAGHIFIQWLAIGMLSPDHRPAKIFQVIVPVVVPVTAFPSILFMSLFAVGIAFFVINLVIMVSLFPLQGGKADVRCIHNLHMHDVPAALCGGSMAGSTGQGWVHHHPRKVGTLAVRDAFPIHVDAGKVNFFSVGRKGIPCSL